MNGLALCAGIGGLDLGLKLAIGESYRTICYVEREAYAAAALVARMEDATLDSAPIWDDLTTFDGRHWRGIVDIITAGFPCQPFSYAGRRKGVNDDRWLWPDIERIIQQVRPGYVFLENVPGLFTSGFGHVLGSLASLGFNAEWDVFSAAGVGAPHLRKRVFILAYHQSIGWEQGRPEFKGEQGGPYPIIGGSPLADPPGLLGKTLLRDESDGVLPLNVADASSGEFQGEGRRSEGRNGPRSSGEDVADAQEQRKREPTDQTKPLSIRWETRFELGGGGWWSTEPELGRVAYGIPNRVDRLRALGNGVVPLVAAVAFRTLIGRIKVESLP